MAGPKIILIDVETSPIVAYTWGPKWETNLIEVIEESRIISFSAKVLGGKQHTTCLSDYKGYKKGTVDDSKIMADLWAILDTADIVIAHNGVAFDAKTINTRLLANGLGPPSPYKVLDTKTIARSLFRLPSNALDDICGYFKLGRKLEHEGFPLWKKCIAGDKTAWRKMKKYNAHDVALLEDWYLLARPWIRNHPNLGAYTGKPHSCHLCGVAGRLQRRGWNINKVTRSPRYFCTDCGGWSHGKASKIENIELR